MRAAFTASLSFGVTPSGVSVNRVNTQPSYCDSYLFGPVAAITQGAPRVESERSSHILGQPGQHTSTAGKEIELTAGFVSREEKFLAPHSSEKEVVVRPQ